IDFNFFASLISQLGATEKEIEAAKSANTSIEVLKNMSHLPLGNLICEKAWQFASECTPDGIEIDVWAIDRQGQLAGCYLPNGDSH
ncbi:MAG: hypothetical protein JKY24_06950, partial [Pseudomonadales bacterium]|nr:hypothetical protein [Pseudomonadales bacterium]